MSIELDDTPRESRFVEVTIRFLDENEHVAREVYVQRVNYDWVFTCRPTMIQQIIAAVNDLELRIPEPPEVSP